MNSLVEKYELIKNTAWHRDTRPLGARTSEIHSFELDPKTLEIRGFYADFTRIFKKEMVKI